MTALTSARCNDSVAPDAKRCLRGTPASPGRGSGRAFVVETPEDVVIIPPGAILVVPTLSVRFASAFAQAAGVVAEHGGPLSTGATLAREAGVPAVVLEGATALLQGGDAVVIDGASGGVTVQRVR